MVYRLLDWLTSKAVIDTTLQLFSFLALCLYAWDTNRMKREMLRQGKASIRPFFSFGEQRSGVSGAEELAELSNVGSGIAYNVVWKMIGFRAHEKGEVGAVPPNVSFRAIFPTGKPLRYDMIAKGGGVLITYEDSAGTRYWSALRRERTNVYTIQTGQNRPPLD